MGDDEINLVRKKFKWHYEPFEIPSNLLDEWRKIGKKNSKIADKHEVKYKKIFKNNKDLTFFERLIDKAKNDFLKTLNP